MRKRWHSSYDFVGNRFGKLIIIRWVPGEGSARGKWEYKCDCGNTGRCFSSQLTDKKKLKTMCNDCASRQPRKDSEEKGIRKEYNNYRNNAKGRGLSFEFSEEEFSSIIKKPCYYCGIDPYPRGPWKVSIHGIDRKDNGIGYTSENIVTCCKMCNHMKRDYTEEQFINHITLILNKRNSHV